MVNSLIWAAQSIVFRAAQKYNHMAFDGARQELTWQHSSRFCLLKFMTIGQIGQGSSSKYLSGEMCTMHCTRLGFDFGNQTCISSPVLQSVCSPHEWLHLYLPCIVCHIAKLKTC